MLIEIKGLTTLPEGDTKQIVLDSSVPDAPHQAARDVAQTIGKEIGARLKATSSVRIIIEQIEPKVPKADFAMYQPPDYTKPLSMQPKHILLKNEAEYRYFLFTYADALRYISHVHRKHDDGTVTLTI